MFTNLNNFVNVSPPPKPSYLFPRVPVQPTNLVDREQVVDNAGYVNNRVETEFNLLV